MIQSKQASINQVFGDFKPLSRWFWGVRVGRPNFCKPPIIGCLRILLSNFGEGSLYIRITIWPEISSGSCKKLPKYVGWNPAVKVSVSHFPPILPRCLGQGGRPAHHGFLIHVLVILVETVRMKTFGLSNCGKTREWEWMFRSRMDLKLWLQTLQKNIS